MMSEKEAHERFGKILSLVSNDPRFTPFKDRVKVFGSMAKGTPSPHDLDLFVDCSDADTNDPYQVKGLIAFLWLCRQNYGWVDVFVRVKKRLYVRDDDANWWQVAQKAREIGRAIKTDGIPLDDAIAVWSSRAEVL